MSLMRRGALFAGALFAGMLFGPRVQAEKVTQGGTLRRRPQAEYFNPVPWQALARKRDDEDALLLAALL